MDVPVRDPMPSHNFPVNGYREGAWLWCGRSCYFPDLGSGADVMDIPAGADPSLVTIPLRPAGAICGEIEPATPGANLSIIWER